MPSTPKMILDLSVSVLLITGGAWLAAKTPVSLALAQDFQASPALASNQITQVSQSETISGSVVPPSNQAEPRPHLSVEIAPLRNTQGRLLVLVFDEAEAYETFNWTQAIEFTERNANASNLTFEFEALTDGPYAIFVMHDEDSNYELAMQDDMPLEGYASTGMSNWYDTPDFETASVNAVTIDIQLFYPG